MADPFCSREPLLGCYFEPDSQSLRHVFGLGHHLRCKRACVLRLNNLSQRRACQRADGVEGNAAHKLYPHLVANVASNRASETGSNKRVRYAPAAIGLCAVRLAKRKARALDMLDHAGLDNDS